MDEQSFTGLRWSDLIMIAVVGTLLCVGSVFAANVLQPETPTAPASPPAARAWVVGVKCDGSGHVSALRVAVSAPGVLELEWDARTACGSPA